MASPVFGWGGDRGSRPRWMGLGVGLWSLATGLAGLARSFTGLFAARAAVGVGEAAYGTISYSLLADYVAPDRRGGVMAVFSAAIPVGSALGYMLGGALGARYGWRSAFFVVGFPGLLLAFFVYLMRDPARGRSTPRPSAARCPARGVPGPRAEPRLPRDRRRLRRLHLRHRRPRHLDAELPARRSRPAAGAGHAGLRRHHRGDGLRRHAGRRLDRRLTAGARAQRLRLAVGRRHGRGLGVHPGRPARARTRAFLVLLAVAELFLFANTGPVNALIVNTVRPGIRATASGTAILLIHVLGDAISPPLMGAVADDTLATAMLVVPAVFLLAGVLWLGSWQRTGASRR